MESPNALAQTTGRTVPSDEATSLPSELDSPTAKLVLLYVRTATETTVEEISSDLRVSQLALYPVLDSLSSRGFVEQRGATYRPDGADSEQR